MSNQQLYPSSSYPGSGDILTTAGSPTTKVVGIQTYPFSSTPPLTNQVPVFDGTTWVPSSTSNSQANKSIQVNGIVMSDDYDVSVNATLGIAGSPLLVNGA